MAKVSEGRPAAQTILTKTHAWRIRTSGSTEGPEQRSRFCSVSIGFWGILQPRMTRSIFLAVLLGWTSAATGQDASAPPVAGPPERAWDLAGMVVIRHGARVSSTCVSSDGSLLATAGFDGQLRLWNTKTGFVPAGGPLPEGGRSLEAPAWVVCFSPDTALLASAGGESGTGGEKGFEILVERLAPGGPGPLRLRGHTGTVLALAFSPRGEFLVSGGADRTLRIWTLADPAKPKVLKGHERGITGVQVSPGGRLLYSGSADGTVREWDARSGEERRRVDVGGHPASSISLSPDGRLLAVTDPSGTLRVKDVLTGLDRAVFPSHENSAPAVAFSPDGARMAWGGYDGRIRLGSLDGYSTWVGTLGAWVTSLAFAPDGAWIVAGLADGSAAILRPPPLEAEAVQAGPADPAALWTDLGERNPEGAAMLVRRWSAALRGGAPEARAASLAFLKEHLSVIPEGRIDPLIRQLDDEEYEMRMRASGELERIGSAAEPAVRKALDGSPSAELRERLTGLLQRLKGQSPASPDVLRVLRAIEVLERTRTQEAAALLGILAQGVESGRETVEAQQALERHRKVPRR